MTMHNTEKWDAYDYWEKFGNKVRRNLIDDAVNNKSKGVAFLAKKVTKRSIDKLSWYRACAEDETPFGNIAMYVEEIVPVRGKDGGIIVGFMIIVKGKDMSYSKKQYVYECCCNTMIEAITEVGNVISNGMRYEWHELAKSNKRK